MTNPIFIDAGEVAARLSISRALFLRQRDWMETNLGFPVPVSWARSPMKWRANAIDTWILQQGLPAGQGPTTPTAAAPQPIPAGNRAMMEEASRP